MVEKKTTTKETAAKKTTVAKKTTCKKTTSCSTKAAVATTVDYNAENVGFKAGDVYQALATAEKALTIKEIAKAAKISEEETLLGMGWLFKEGKITTAEGKVALV
ncbi:MAG: winged helix-turn-helix domain-containing protein [Prevotella sp.]|nr:winged helix-turn-helix domain-containing protein [Prevotella sp.]